MRIFTLMDWVYGWTDHPTSSDMGMHSVQRCVGIMLEYHDRDSHDDIWIEMTSYGEYTVEVHALVW